MKIWLIGHHGMLGRCVHEALEQRQLEVVATDVEVDITDRETVEAVIAREQPDSIINCAAFTDVDGAESNETAAFALNERGPANLAQAAALKKIPLVHISTDYVFGGIADAAYTEDEPTGPIGVYGRSKLAGERAVREAYASGETPHWILRTSWLFAAHGKNFVCTMARLIAEREQLRVVDDQRGRPTYAPDLATAILHLLGLYAAARAPAGIYHVANRGVTTWHGLASAVREGMLARGEPVVCEKIEPVATDEFPTAARRPAWSVLATEKLEETGFRPRSWEKALDACLNTLLGVNRPI